MYFGILDIYTPVDGDVNKQYYTLSAQLFIKVMLVMHSIVYHYR